jgi:hypothetical protein
MEIAGHAGQPDQLGSDMRCRFSALLLRWCPNILRDREATGASP